MDAKDEGALRECLVSGLSAVLHQPPAIVHIHQTRFDNSTSFLAEVLTLQLANGDELKIFLKDFGSSRLTKDDLPQRRERELLVYRDLLARTDLGTAKYYGAVWDATRQRFWLLLEFVDGIELRSCAFDPWVGVAGWLGDMQGHFADRTEELNACDFLVRHDACFFWSKAEQAQQAVAQVSVGLAQRLDRILSYYGRVVDVMVSQPRTLVHGSYRPENILVNLNVEPMRVCPIDWELAAWGAPLYDLAFLSDGFRPPRLDMLWDAYRQHAAQYHLVVPDRADMRRVVDCFRLHKIVKSLSECVSWNFPESTIAKLVQLGEDLNCQLDQ